MTADSQQTEREAALPLCANCQTVFSYDNEGAQDEWGAPLCGTCFDFAQEVKVYVVAARAAGRAEGRTDRIEDLERYLARTQELEGALREAVRYLDTDTESWWSDKFEAKINRWRALLPFPAEGPEASEGDDRG